MQFTTAEEYVRYQAERQRTIPRFGTRPPDPAGHLIDILRYLPREEARILLMVFGYVSDGDYGYGSWEAGLEFLLDPSKGD